jgi:FkbM family methyltransferase
MGYRDRRRNPAPKPSRAFFMAVIVCFTFGAGHVQASPFDDLLDSGQVLYSQRKQELIIRHFFKDRTDGFFVDVGCFHWKDSSTTCYLERHLDWSGIAIDAQEKFRPEWEKYRPKSKFFAYAVTDKSGETITFYLTGDDSDTRTGGTSSTETTNLEKWQKKVEMEVRETTVPTITLNDLLDREGVEKIDFLSMDINGAEPIALRGFDIKRFKPELVSVEANVHRREELLEYFEENGYSRIDEYLEHDRIDWYFKPKNTVDDPEP